MQHDHVALELKSIQTWLYSVSFCWNSKLQVSRKVQIYLNIDIFVFQICFDSNTILHVEKSLQFFTISYTVYPLEKLEMFLIYLLLKCQN